MDYPGEQMLKEQAGTSAMRPIRRTLTQKLEDEKMSLENRIKEIDEVLEGLHAHPEVEKLMNLVTKYV